MLADEDAWMLFSNYIRYYSAKPKEKAFVEEVARVTWERQQEQRTGEKSTVRPTFSA